MQLEDDPRRAFWFRARPNGYGAGWPLNWKGWTLWAAMLVMLAIVPYALQRLLSPSFLIPTTIVAIALVMMPFVWIAKGRTEPRWRRR